MAWINLLTFLGFYIGLFHTAITFEVTLLDTRQEGTLDWVTHSDSSRGWREASFNSQGDVFRVYTVCNLASQSDNWLRLPYVENSGANRLYIEIKFTMRHCLKYPDPERLQQCKESFQLMYYEAEADFANSERPTWDSETYSFRDVIAADKTFTDIDESIINTETRDVAITRRGLYFAIRDQGACTTIISVRIYYIMCPSVILNFTIFPNTTTGPDRSSIIQQSGICVSHAAMEKAPSYLCKGDGTWSLLTGGCKCMPGYEPDGDGNDQACKPCDEGYYKWRTGSGSCHVCPAYSEALTTGAVECQCQSRYYRSVQDDKSQPCTKPPTEVRNLTVIYKDQTMINLTWVEPRDLGGRRDLTYRVECADCGTLVTYLPSSVLQTTRVSLLGLNPSTNYKILVHAENGVSTYSNVSYNTHVYVRTDDAIPARVSHVRVTNIGLDYVSLSWDPPTELHTTIDQYEVKYVMRLGTSGNHTYTTRQNLTIPGLAHETEYSFQVRARTSKGWGEYTDQIYAKTGSKDIVIQDKIDPTPSPDNPIGIIAGSAVAVVVCMVIVIVMVIIVVRRFIKRAVKGRSRGRSGHRHHRPCNEKNVSDCDTLQYSNVQCPHILDGSHVMNGGLTMPLFTAPGGIKTYVDPHTYEDPNQAVREFTKEIDSSFITIESVIGGGEFGDVCKGIFKLSGQVDKTVAIKTLKAGTSDKNRLDFLTEASIMGQFDDPNVIYLEGVVTKSNPIMIVTEFMENGSLDTFLRNNDGQFTVIQLVGMMRGIAAGMKYLSEMGYVHRDLAARNILVNENLICKVADFGLSREVETENSTESDGAYTTKGGKIPVRWTAPEAIAYRKFTSASDVWSYGVVMWEIIAYGERPYWNWSNHVVITEVDNGFRLPPPMDCPEAIYQLMLNCWKKERSQRPKMNSLVTDLDNMIRNPHLLNKIAQPRQDHLPDPGSPELTGLETVEEWLTSIKMERYTEHFLQAGFTTMEQVAQITLKDLITLGIILVGHQKKIMNSVQTFRALFFGAQMSDGYLV